MSDSHDSWKKFAEAGFVEEADGKLRLGTGRCFCTVARAGGELAVHFEPGVSGFQAVDFKVPVQMDDFWQWVAFVTSRIVGSPERWRSLRKALGDEMPEDLVELLNIGVDHLDEAPGTEAEETRPKSLLKIS